ncbi:RNA-binding S4 domain-containing protein [Egbenema bharatensis]|uniref:RNA-binding S4 domain-containing protein n=1 Tax=Egbenema bharatensis TaxID=3463334 RepID=UPI003A88CA53
MAAQGDTIRLDQFLKWAGVVQTGGEAKVLIQFGEVEVNGETETRRGRKLVEGDRVSFQGQDFTVALDRSSELEEY